MIWEDLNWIREYRFPISSTNTSYVETTTRWGKAYISRVQQCAYIPANEANTIKKHIDGLLYSLRLFLSGNPYAAYEHFCTAMDLVKEHLRYSKIGTDPRFFGCSVSYYRVQKLDSKPFNYKQMLHVPYNLRNIIPAYRFSMPGIPCTYMSTSPEVAWCEAGMPDEYQLAEYSVNDSSGNLLALDINLQDVYSSIRSKAEKSQDSYFDVWEKISQIIYSLPIIAFCSVVKKHDNAKFNEEYIIPQMLMTWISANTNLLGIRYRTSKRFDLGYNISAYNVALLATQEDSDHYSKVLKQLFLHSKSKDKLSKDKLCTIRVQTEIEKHYSDKIQLLNSFYEKVYEESRHKSYPPIYFDFLAICKTALININLLRNETTDNIAVSDKKYNAIITLKSLLRWVNRINEAAEKESYIKSITNLPLTSAEIMSAKEIVSEFKKQIAPILIDISNLDNILFEVKIICPSTAVCRKRRRKYGKRIT